MTLALTNFQLRRVGLEMDVRSLDLDRLTDALDWVKKFYLSRSSVLYAVRRHVSRHSPLCVDRTHKSPHTRGKGADVYRFE